MRILNLYAGLGGNRKLWDGHEIVAVEFDKQVADFYKNTFPNDEVIIGDAHEYLRLYHGEFDFIWTSPPCQTHSSFRHNICVRFRGTEAQYPDMRLYQEIIFLKHHAKCKFVVENVKPYYEPLIAADKQLARHLFWCNFSIDDKVFDAPKIRTAQIPDLQRYYGFNLDGYKISDKRQKLRNCVIPELGQHILDCAKGVLEGE